MPIRVHPLYILRTYHSLLIDSLAHCLNYRHLEVWRLFKKKLRLKFAARAKHIRCTVVRNEAREVPAKSFPPPCSPVAAIKAFSGTVESLMDEAIFQDFSMWDGSDLVIQK